MVGVEFYCEVVCGEVVVEVEYFEFVFEVVNEVIGCVCDVGKGGGVYCG